MTQMQNRVWRQVTRHQQKSMPLSKKLYQKLKREQIAPIMAQAAIMDAVGRQIWMTVASRMKNPPVHGRKISASDEIDEGSVSKEKHHEQN